MRFHNFCFQKQETKSKNNEFLYTNWNENLNLDLPSSGAAPMWQKDKSKGWEV